MPPGEFELIERFFTRRGATRADVRLGVGDDAAIVTPAAAAECVLAAAAASTAAIVLEQQENWILELRRERNLGVRRIQSELQRQHNYSLSLSTIQKVLQKHLVKPLKKIRRHKKVKRYQCDTPGERVQMDTCKIGPGVYQFTAVDDCTRYKVVAIYSRVSAKNTLQFLEKLVEEMPFPIQRIQTDRGKEFFAYQVQETLMEWGIKFRPIRPRSPHLNGKVERAQKTDLEEFYSTVDIKQPDLEDRLQEWQHYYNWYRVHGSIGKPPIDKFFELSLISRADPRSEVATTTARLTARCCGQPGRSGPKLTGISRLSRFATATPTVSLAMPI